VFVYDLHAILVPSAIGMDTGAKSINQIAKKVPGARIKGSAFRPVRTRLAQCHRSPQSPADTNDAALPELTGGFNTVEPFHGSEVRPFG
jgi:hypothetical protein